VNDKGRYRQLDCGRGKRLPLNVCVSRFRGKLCTIEVMSTQEFRIVEVLTLTSFIIHDPDEAAIPREDETPRRVSTWATVEIPPSNRIDKH
jgi:hypothetical protein